MICVGAGARSHAQTTVHVGQTCGSPVTGLQTADTQGNRTCDAPPDGAVVVPVARAMAPDLATATVEPGEVNLGVPASGALAHDALAAGALAIGALAVWSACGCCTWCAGSCCPGGWSACGCCARYAGS